VSDEREPRLFTPEEYREGLWDDFVASVRFLPKWTQTRGIGFAVAFFQTEVSTQMDTMAVGVLGTREAAKARAALNLFYNYGSALLLCEGGYASYWYATDFLRVVRATIFQSGVVAVFQRMLPTVEKKYAPNVPTD
jgi:hypothetical protein